MDWAETESIPANRVFNSIIALVGSRIGLVLFGWHFGNTVWIWIAGEYGFFGFIWLAIKTIVFGGGLAITVCYEICRWHNLSTIRRINKFFKNSKGFDLVGLTALMQRQVKSLSGQIYPQPDEESPWKSKLNTLEVANSHLEKAQQSLKRQIDDHSRNLSPASLRKTADSVRQALPQVVRHLEDLSLVVPPYKRSEKLHREYKIRVEAMMEEIEALTQKFLEQAVALERRERESNEIKKAELAREKERLESEKKAQDLDRLKFDAEIKTASAKKAEEQRLAEEAKLAREKKEYEAKADERRIREEKAREASLKAETEKLRLQKETLDQEQRTKEARAKALEEQRQLEQEQADRDRKSREASQRETIAKEELQHRQQQERREKELALEREKRAVEAEKARQVELEKEKVRLEKIQTASEFGLDDFLKAYRQKLEGTSVEEIHGKNHAELFELYSTLKDTFLRLKLVPLDQLEKVPEDVHRLDQIEVIMDLYTEKIRRVRESHLDPDEQELKIDYWIRLRDKEIQALEEA